MLVDSHCHIDFPDLIEDEAGVLARMADNGVTHALCVSVKLETLQGILALAERHANVFASVGVHPDNADCEEPDEERLLALAAHPKVVAIGETGLDYYWHKDAPEWQRVRFRTHIRAARRSAKPLIIHTRDSAADTIRLMREEDAGATGGVMHCFTETREVAEQALDLGFHISFSGIVSFKNAEALREVGRAMCRPTACWWKPTRPIWHQCRTAARQTSLLMSVMSPRQSPRHAARAWSGLPN